jgi:hypothetical protein
MGRLHFPEGHGGDGGDLVRVMLALRYKIG